MNKRQKILFYGNCQICAISNYFEENLPQYEIVDCSDCGVVPFWSNSKAFCVWTPDNKQSQKDFYSCIHEKITEADVFIFQDHSGKAAIPELHTKYLHDHISNGLRICVPDARFFAHLNDKEGLKPYIDYVKTIHKEPTDIIKYLQESDDPKLTELLKNEYPMNRDFVRYRGENIHRYEQERKIYDTRLDTNGWMESQYKHQKFTVTHNHMGENYFVELIRQLYKHLDINIDTHPIDNVSHPPGYDIIDPNQFKFFRDYFPDIRVNLEGKILRSGKDLFR